MAVADTLEQLPMTMGYFRLILRSFGDTAERRAAILAGTGVTEAALVDPAADISLRQQVCQFENLNALEGEGWPFKRPDLWSQASHGAVAVAAMSAPDLGAALDIIAIYSRARAPFSRIRVRRTERVIRFDYELEVPLTEAQLLPIVEISFMALHSALGTLLGRFPDEARFRFAGGAPSYDERVREVLGPGVLWDAAVTGLDLPVRLLATTSPFADPALHARAIEELDLALKRLATPLDLRGRVERLLRTVPDGRLDADTAARAVGVSRRTLVRRLSEAGTSFRKLVDTDLSRRASQLLDASTLSHAQIAARLGYSDPTSFSRARRRWIEERERGRGL